MDLVISLWYTISLSFFIFFRGKYIHILLVKIFFLVRLSLKCDFFLSKSMNKMAVIGQMSILTRRCHHNCCGMQGNYYHPKLSTLICPCYFVVRTYIATYPSFLPKPYSCLQWKLNLQIRPCKLLSTLCPSTIHFWQYLWCSITTFLWPKEGSSKSAKWGLINDHKKLRLI